MLPRDRTEPRPHAQAAFGMGPGLIRRFIARSPRRSGHAPVCPSRRRSRCSFTPQVWSPPGADGDEGTRGRRDLACGITAPAGDRAVAPHPAGVCPPGADGEEGTRGRRGPAKLIRAPAGDGAIAPHLAGVVPPGAHGDERTAGGVARPYSLSPQQATEPSLLNPQVCSIPALTESKEPAGGVDWPCPL